MSTREVDDWSAIRDQYEKMNAWQNIMIVWYIFHFGLGAAAIVLSVTVASKPDFVVHNGPATMNFLSWLLAIVTGFVTFLGPADRANRYQRAHRVLLTEITLYKADRTYPLDHVVKAYNQGEDIIHGTKDK